MVRLYIFFTNLVKTIIGKVFFVLNYAICLFLFDWGKFSRYLNSPARVNCHFKPVSRGIDFCLYGASINPIEAIFELVIAVTTFPSMIITQAVINVLKTQNPLWCYETFDIIYLPIFAVVNSFYWLLLGYGIEVAHSAYLRNKPLYTKPKILGL